MEMPDIAYQMQDVRWVSGIVFGIDFIYAGQFQHLKFKKMTIYTDFLWI